MLFDLLFLNSKSTKNKRKKLRDHIVSDEDLGFHCAILFFSFFMKVNASSIFALILRLPAAYRIHFPKKLFVYF